MEGLSILDEGDGGLVFDAERGQEREADLSLCLVGKNFTDKTIHAPIMKDRMVIMLCLSLFQPEDILEEIPLTHVLMWVQVLDLPVGFMSSVVGTAPGNFIGSFVEYDKNNNTGIWRSFMRIRVNVDTREPLKKKKVKKHGGEWRVVKSMKG